MLSTGSTRDPHPDQEPIKRVVAKLRFSIDDSRPALAREAIEAITLLAKKYNSIHHDDATIDVIADYLLARPRLQSHMSSENEVLPMGRLQYCSF